MRCNTEENIKKLDDWFDNMCPLVLPNGIMVHNHRFFYSHEKYMEMYMPWRFRWTQYCKEEQTENASGTFKGVDRESNQIRIETEDKLYKEKEK